MSTTTKSPEEQAAMPPATHDKTNSWFDGKQWIPVENMTDSHLKRAKLFAQKKEEYFSHKSFEFGAKVDMLEAEAERRKLKLKDYRSKFQHNNRVLKDAMKRDENEKV